MITLNFMTVFWVFAMSVPVMAEWTYVDCVDHALHPLAATSANMYFNPDGTSQVNAVTDWTGSGIRYRSGLPGYFEGSIYEVHKDYGDPPVYIHIDTGAPGVYSIKLYGSYNGLWANQVSLDGGVTWSTDINAATVSAVDGIDGQGWVDNSTGPGVPIAKDGTTRGNNIAGNVATTDGNIYIGIRTDIEGQRGWFDGLAYRSTTDRVPVMYPQPANGLQAGNLKSITELLWTIPFSDGTEVCKVYFGDEYDYDPLNSDHFGLPVIQNNITGTSIPIPGDLTEGSTYYWIVDYTCSDGNTIGGDLWSFSSFSHPRLIVKESEFDDWRALRSDWPWSVFSYGYWNSNPTWNRPIKSKVSSGMLGYILDTDSVSPTRSDYCQAVIDGINGLYVNDFASINTSHSSYIYTAAGAISCMLAFDVIYDAPELSAADRSTAYSQLDEIVTWYKNNYTQRGWRLCPYGLFSTWAIFKGDPAEITTEVERYRSYLMETLQMPDGAWTAAPGYFTARIAGMGRLAKTAPIDIISHTGNYYFYNDLKMQGFADWACNFWLTPFNAEQMFGDTTVNYGRGPSAFHVRMGRYSEKHGRIGKWFLNHVSSSGFVDTGYGVMSAYIYATTPANFPDLEPLMPESLLMDYYGASLWGRNGDTEALMGTLHSYGVSSGQDFGHAHQDTCSIHIAGYGEHLLFNSSGTIYSSATRHLQEAQYQNVVLIGGRKTHDTKYGNGLTDGLTGGQIEYGRTDSGNALGNGRHYRNLYLVHETPGVNNGYFILLDEVAPDNPIDNIKINLHPNSTTTTAVSSNLEYRCPVNYIIQSSASDRTEAINVFYGTPPNQVNITVGQHYDGSSVDNINYLEAVYTAGSDGWLRAATILFPEDGMHSKAAMARVSGAGYTGATVSHASSAVDTFLVSNNAGTFARSGISFCGTGVFYRTDNGVVTNYAVTGGCLFDDGQTDRRGFYSTADVSIQMDELTGNIAMDSAGDLTLYYPGIETVLVDGHSIPQTLNSGSVTLSLEAGEHTLAIGREAQVEMPFKLGNASTSGNADSWKSNLVINETDTYTNSSDAIAVIRINSFEFYAGAIADPVTPFVVKVNGDNSFTVVAEGTTRTSYSVGANTVAFDEASAPVVTVAPGETIAVGFLDANSDGSGGGMNSVIPFDETSPKDEIWYSGGTEGSDSGSVSKDSAPSGGKSTLTNLTRNYHFNITFVWINWMSDTTTFMDFELFSSQWLRTDCGPVNGYCSGADVNRDKYVDINDLQFIAYNWLY